MRFKELVGHACIRGRPVVLSPYRKLYRLMPQNPAGDVFVSKQNLLITNTLKKRVRPSQNHGYISDPLPLSC
jgi:hypothetical protein